MPTRNNWFHIGFLCGLILWLGSCDRPSGMFELIDPSHSNIHFNNLITENDTFNILDYEYVYNGGGVGIGDFNNDGLEDVFFSGNMVSNKLYINKGDFEFEDISTSAGIDAYNRWSQGISVIDINGDGWKDIYVSNHTYDDPADRRNELWINQGLDASGNPSFVDQAEPYGLADDSYSVNAAFFDYDNDMDLDVMIIINEMQDTRYPSAYRKKKKRKASYQRVDRLYQNNFDESKGHPVYTNVSEQAGINVPGYSLGINITDINHDGWQDIFISNDFISNDVLYINQKDGTFVDESKKYFKHTSHSAMGNDVVDINNDGLSDIIALDMMPEDNYRQKTMLGPNNYSHYLNNEKFGYTYQCARNTLQLNRGFKSDGELAKFSEVSLMSGMAKTDWSWTPLVADFDCDGKRDIIITNGFPKDVTDRDFMDYKADNITYAPQDMMISKIPSVKIKNYAYRNLGDVQFEDVGEAWGIHEASYSNGAAYADFDNDGDLDYVVNNIKDSVHLYQNHLDMSPNRNYFKLKLKGKKSNPSAFGTKIELVLEDGETLWMEQSPTRGYLSCLSDILHFGLGENDTIATLRLTWPDGKITGLTNVLSNQLLELEWDDGETIIEEIEIEEELLTSSNLFDEFVHKEDDYIDYNIQPLLPHKLSQFGPAISVCDVNQDGLEDLYVSGPVFYHGYFMIQQQDGGYQVDSFRVNNKNAEELSTLFFDADQDGDQDLYMTHGSYEIGSDDPLLQDKFFENQGGSWKYLPEALPNFLAMGLAAKAADFDQDGDLDVFVGTRGIQGEYPLSGKSHLFVNASKKGQIKFEEYVAEDNTLFELGMVTDALWTDYNQDGWIDLIVCAELSDIQFIKNNKGYLEKDNTFVGHHGFWNSISGGDLDNDGDIDYVLGNTGLNTFTKISKEYPYKMYVHDFDKNGSTDALPFSFFKDTEGEMREFPFMTRMEFTKEINAIRKMYPSYAIYAKADINTIITDSTKQLAKIFEVDHPESAILWNEGNGFSLESLPFEAQISPVYASMIKDINNDGKNDILLVGNDFGNELLVGRMDASNGLLLLGAGDRKFEVASASSGFYVPGDSKSLVNTMHASGKEIILAGVNNEKLTAFELDAEGWTILCDEADRFVMYKRDGQRVVTELYHGSSFLSSRTRKIIVPSDVTSVEITNYKGEKRQVSKTNNPSE